MSTPATRAAHTALGNGSNADQQLFSRRKTRSLLRILHAKHSSQFGFWNLRNSIARDPATSGELTAALAARGLSICGLAGAWKWASGEHEVDGRRVLWSGTRPQDPGHGCGVGLHLDGDARAALTSWKAAGPRLLWARFVGTISPSVIVAYAPVAKTTQASKAARKKFFNDLQGLLESVPGLDFLVILGDFNSQVGGAASARQGAGVLGALCDGLARRPAPAPGRSLQGPLRPVRGAHSSVHGAAPHERSRTTWWSLAQNREEFAHQLESLLALA